MGRLRKFCALDRQRQRLFLQAFYQLGMVNRDLSRKPFKSLVSEFTPASASGSLVPQNPVMAGLAQDIGWAVRAAAVRTPWKSSCLVQVLAAQRMLKARGIGGEFYIGASLGEVERVRDFQAHAWLMSGGAFITGENGHEQYTVVSGFSWQ